MSAIFTGSAPRQTFFAKPADLNAATIYTATGVQKATLEGMNIAVTGASNVTVWLNNGTTDYLLLDAFVMAANTQVLHSFGSPTLRNGWAVKVKTSNADDATFTLTVAEEFNQT